MPGPARVVGTIACAAILTVAGACGGRDAAPSTTPQSPSTSEATAATIPTTPATTLGTPLFDAEFRPVLPPGPNRWESLYVDPGAVISHNGTLHMFYDGIYDWPAQAEVGHATSPDGLGWERLGDDSLFTGRGVDWIGISLFASDSVVLDDGTWVIYFHASGRINTPAGSTIGMATAPAPDGPWRIEPGPILEPGAPGSWDEIAVLNPSVVQVGDEWWMYYDGQRGDEAAHGDRSVGIATSSDGLVWEKWIGPVLEPGAAGDWDDGRVYDPNVVRTGDGFVMSYLTSDADLDLGTLEHSFGIATSRDGISWVKHPANPVLDTRAVGLGAVFLSSLEYHDGSYLLFFDPRGGPAGETTVWLLSHEGTLPPP